MKKTLFNLNRDLFRTSGLLTLTLYTLETLKEGFVSLFFNPAIILVIFIISGCVWLFDPKNSIDQANVWE